MVEKQKKGEAIVIKKYANRRLYDTNKSSYVTLEDLCDMVKKDIDFVVLDAKSEEDLTRSVLTQIIFEQESKGFNILPIKFLRQIIGFYGNSLESVLPSYLEKTMEHFTENQGNLRKSMDSSSDFSPFKQFEDMSKRNMEMFEKTMSMFSPFGTKK